MSIKKKRAANMAHLHSFLTAQRSKRTGEIKMNKEQAQAVIDIVETTLTDDGYAMIKDGEEK